MFGIKKKLKSAKSASFVGFLAPMDYDEAAKHTLKKQGVEGLDEENVRQGVKKSYKKGKLLRWASTALGAVAAGAFITASVLGAGMPLLAAAAVGGAITAVNIWGVNNTAAANHTLQQLEKNKIGIAKHRAISLYKAICTAKGKEYDEALDYDHFLAKKNSPTKFAKQKFFHKVKAPEIPYFSDVPGEYALKQEKKALKKKKKELDDVKDSTSKKAYKKLKKKYEKLEAEYETHKEEIELWKKKVKSKNKWRSGTRIMGVVGAAAVGTSAVLSAFVPGATAAGHAVAAGVSRLPGLFNLLSLGGIDEEGEKKGKKGKKQRKNPKKSEKKKTYNNLSRLRVRLQEIERTFVERDIKALEEEAKSSKKLSKKDRKHIVKRIDQREEIVNKVIKKLNLKYAKNGMTEQFVMVLHRSLESLEQEHDRIKPYSKKKKKIIINAIVDTLLDEECVKTNKRKKYCYITKKSIRQLRHIDDIEWYTSSSYEEQQQEELSSSGGKSRSRSSSRSSKDKGEKSSKINKGFNVLTKLLVVRLDEELGQPSKAKTTKDTRSFSADGSSEASKHSSKRSLSKPMKHDSERKHKKHESKKRKKKCDCTFKGPCPAHVPFFHPVPINGLTPAYPPVPLPHNMVVPLPNTIAMHQSLRAHHLVPQLNPLSVMIFPSLQQPAFHKALPAPKESFLRRQYGNVLNLVLNRPMEKYVSEIDYEENGRGGRI